MKKLSPCVIVGLVGRMALLLRWALFWALLLGAAASVVQAATNRKFASPAGVPEDGCHCEKVSRVASTKGSGRSSLEMILACGHTFCGREW